MIVPGEQWRDSATHIARETHEVGVSFGTKSLRLIKICCFSGRILGFSRHILIGLFFVLKHSVEAACRVGIERWTEGKDLWTQRGRRRRGRLGEWRWNTHPTVCKAESCGDPAWCPVITWGVEWGSGWGEAHEGGDTRILTAGSHCCMAEASTTVQSNYSSIKNFKEILV